MDLEKLIRGAALVYANDIDVIERRTRGQQTAFKQIGTRRKILDCILMKVSIKHEDINYNLTAVCFFIKSGSIGCSGRVI